MSYWLIFISTIRSDGLIFVGSIFVHYLLSSFIQSLRVSTIIWTKSHAWSYFQKNMHVIPNLIPRSKNPPKRDRQNQYTGSTVKSSNQNQHHPEGSIYILTVTKQKVPVPQSGTKTTTITSRFRKLQSKLLSPDQKNKSPQSTRRGAFVRLPALCVIKSRSVRSIEAECIMMSS